MHPSNGFNIPVEMRIKTPDSIFDLEGNKATYNSITGSKTYTSRKIPSKSSFEGILNRIDNAHEFTEKKKFVYTTIQVKSSDLLFTVISIFYSYISLIVTVFILYLLRRTLIPLKKEI
ncbi:MAG TPA: hypothetical protein DEG69_07535, partial [Flavobacteriaceae bacterium]|nr:hypothetical protein [Flavobacteriaceae bacterium]